MMSEPLRADSVVVYPPPWEPRFCTSFDRLPAGRVKWRSATDRLATPMDTPFSRCMPC